MRHRKALIGIAHLCVRWDIEWPTGAMIMVLSSSAVLIWQVRLIVQWVLTGAHPAAMAQWLRKRYLIIQDIFLSYCKRYQENRSSCSLKLYCINCRYYCS